MKNAFSKLLFKIGNPYWIVNQDGEMGFRILGVNFWYYKWPDPMLDLEKEYTWRIMEKREFGETVKSRFVMALSETKSFEDRLAEDL
jgi:hypothetical protein